MRLDLALNDVLRTGSHVRLLRMLDAQTSGVPVSAREAARRAGISHPTASKGLGELTSQGLATVLRIPQTDLYELNREHVLYEPLHMLFERERAVRQELLAVLRKRLAKRLRQGQAAYLFGSAAKGEMNSRSDIDLAIVMPKQKGELGPELSDIEDEIQQRFGTRLNVIVGTKELVTTGKRRRAGRELWDVITREGLQVFPAGARS
jgi:predicted nucleotidyltransferase